MSLTAIAVDFDEALDVQAFHSAKIAFDLVIAALLNFFTNFVELFFCQILNSAFVGDADFLQILTAEVRPIP
jgi:hypothetical protein